jgi:hypothetical protein
MAQGKSNDMLLPGALEPVLDRSVLDFRPVGRGSMMLPRTGRALAGRPPAKELDDE